MATDERHIIDLITVDFSKGQDALMEDILGRCLAAMGEQDESKSGNGWAELSDDQLDMLAAAGDPDAAGETDGDKPRA